MLPTPSRTYDVVIVGTGFHGLSIALEALNTGFSVALISEQSLIDFPGIPFHAVIGAGLGKIEVLNFPEVIANQKALLNLQKRYPQHLSPIDTYIAKNRQVRSDRRVSIGLSIYRRLQGQAGIHTLVPSRRTPPLTQAFFGIQPHALFEPPVQELLALPQRQLITLAQQALSSGLASYEHHSLAGAQRSEQQWSLSLTRSADRQAVKLNAKVLINTTQQAQHAALPMHSRCEISTLSSGWVYINKPQRWQGALLLQLSDKQLAYVFSVSPTTLCLGPIRVNTDDHLHQQLAIQRALNDLNVTMASHLNNDDVIRTAWLSEAIVKNAGTLAAQGYDEAFIDLDHRNGLAPLATVFGTNIAQQKKIARECLALLHYGLPQPSNSHRSPEPAMGLANLLEWEAELQRVFGLSEELCRRLTQYYGTRAQQLLEECDGDLGRHFGSGIYAAEIDYLVEHEWVRSLDDLLWRNTYFGLMLDEHVKREVANYLKEYLTQFEKRHSPEEAQIPA